jgi:hypothetical protein
VTTEEFFGSFDFFDSFVFDAIASRYPPRSAANHDWRFLPSARGEAGDPPILSSPVVPATAHNGRRDKQRASRAAPFSKGTLDKRRLAGGLKSERPWGGEICLLGKLFNLSGPFLSHRTPWPHP